MYGMRRWLNHGFLVGGGLWELLRDARVTDPVNHRHAHTTRLSACRRLKARPWTVTSTIGARHRF